MFKTIQYIVVAVLCLNFSSKAQSQNNNIKPLKIGDKVPEELWKLPLKVINHPEKKRTITLNDYRGKLIILDFWATWCTSCISVMPETNRIEHTFKDKMIIIASSYEPAKKVASFVSSNKNLKPLDLLSVVDDSLLKSYFPHQLVPHYAWISPEGKVTAITGSEAINSKNIELIMGSKDVDVEIKKDININRPLFVNDELNTDKILSYSILTKGYQIGLPGGTQTRQKEGITNRRIFTNSSILTMYMIAAMELFRAQDDAYNTQRLILEVKKPEAIEFHKKLTTQKQWEKLYCYNFDLMVPLTEADQLHKRLIESLNQNLPYYGRIEKRKVKCWVLTTKNTDKQILSDNSEKSLSLEVYSRALNSLDYIHLPIVNETGIKEQVRLIASNAPSMENLMKELHACNLELTATEREINMLVISDRKALSNSTKTK